MSYASKQNMIDRFGQDELIQLTDRATPPAGVIDDAVLNTALAAADAEINGYIQARYSLPLASHPLLIVNLAQAIARYFLYDDQPTEHVEKRYADAVKTLKAISSGVVKLGLDEQSQPTEQANIPKISGPARTFTRKSMGSY